MHKISDVRFQIADFLKQSEIVNLKSKIEMRFTDDKLKVVDEMISHYPGGQAKKRLVAVAAFYSKRKWWLAEQ
jgi:hypothetical protein